MYWLLSGEDGETFQRKKVFSAYRYEFEKILIERKEDVVSSLTRRTGSGAEITFPTAEYFADLLKLIVEHEGQVESEEFSESYDTLRQGLKVRRARQSADPAGTSRLFSDSQKATTFLRELVLSPIRCAICRGILDPLGSVQHDHRVPYSKGGRTLANNNGLTHPFCNNNREAIEEMRSAGKDVALPVPIDLGVDVGIQQLRLHFYNEDDFFDEPR